MHSEHSSRIYFGIFSLVLLLTAGLYWQGLNGVFIFDDQENLGYLTKIDKTDYLSSIAQYTSDALASSLGRPIALLSFALQHESYPIDIQSFKAVNIMLHLLNGCLVFILIALLARLLKISTQQGLLLALCTASIWLLNPFQVSTVLYVVQRMTQLSAFFSLLGLIVYLLGRECIAYNKPIRGFLLVSGGIGVGIVLSVLSKENGILLALLVLVLEWTVLSQYTKPRYWHWWLGFFAYLPLGLLLFYLLGVFRTLSHTEPNTLFVYAGMFLLTSLIIESIIWAWVSQPRWKIGFRILFYSPSVLMIIYFNIDTSVILASYEIRDFNVIERVLTQMRILVEYIAKILLIYPIDYGLFHDDFVVSRSLLNPVSTALSLVLVLSLIGFAVWKRAIYPFIAFGILWFFAGHVLESSFVGLVLYFEHRNYLPSLGIIFALVYVIWLISQVIGQRYRSLFAGMVVFWMLAGIGLTWSQIQLWADPIQQAGTWAAQKPLSRYAQSQAASIAIQLDQPKIAEQYYHHLLRAFPEDSDPYMLLLLLACHYPQQIIMPDIEQEILPALQNQTVNTGTLSSMLNLLEEWDTCPSLNIEKIEALFQTLVIQTEKPYLTIVYNLYAIFKSQIGEYFAAVENISKAIDLGERSPRVYLQRIEWAIAAQESQLAAFYLEDANQHFSPLQQFAFQKQLSYWQMRIQLLNSSLLPVTP